VYSLYEDRAGNFWLGTWTKGIDQFDRKTETFTHFPNDPENSASVSHNGILSFYEDSDNVLWVGTQSGGLNRFDRELQSFIAYRHDPDDPTSLSNNSVVSIYEDQTGVLWIGTNSGLNKFDRIKERFTHYTTKNGLSNDTVNGILEDGNGLLWLSTNQGLSHFDPRTEIFRNYDVSDGLQGNQFTRLAYAKGLGGMMYFGGSNGMTSFDPAQITNNPNIPPVMITNFFLENNSVPINEKSVLSQSILTTESLTLSYQDKIFSFEFAALNFQAPDKSSYRYRLEGLEEKWNEVNSDRRFATYTHIAPGEYTFKVIASNNDGLWNKNGDSVIITILPPWWKTIWFKAFILIFIIGFTYGGFAWRVRTIESKKRQLAIQVTKKTEELKKMNEYLNIEIIERKEAEKELYDSKALLDATGSMALVGGWELDAKTMELKWTNETYRIHQVSSDNKPPLHKAIEFFHPDDRERMSQAIQCALENGEPYDLETRFITSKGNHLWTRSICQPEVINGKTKKLRGAFQDITERKQSEEEREKLILQIQKALKKVKQLSGLLPICANCKKIRDDKGYWNQLETYIHKHSEAQFSHGICPDCSDDLYGTQEWYKKMKKKKNRK